jgi:negative regulator of flagellin synthesis FlgM
MIISGKQVQSVLKAYGDTKLSPGSKADKNSGVQDKDEVIISSKAQEFGSILQSVFLLPEVRQEKVTALSGKIAAGEYHVDAGCIADKMLGRSAI